MYAVGTQHHLVQNMDTGRGGLFVGSGYVGNVNGVDGIVGKDQMREIFAVCMANLVFQEPAVQSVLRKGDSAR